jgi:Flp pilus assembly protein TadD
LLRTALEFEPRSAPTHYALGLLLIRQGDRQQALDALRRAAELAPGNARFVYVYEELERALRQ